jgi:hypothetical protein
VLEHDGRDERRCQVDNQMLGLLEKVNLGC